MPLKKISILTPLHKVATRFDVVFVVVIIFLFLYHIFFCICNPFSFSFLLFLFHFISLYFESSLWQIFLIHGVSLFELKMWREVGEQRCQLARVINFTTCSRLYGTHCRKIRTIFFFYIIYSRTPHDCGSQLESISWTGEWG